MVLLGFLLTSAVADRSFGQQVRTDGKRKIVTQVRPVYPRIAKNNQLSGLVRLSAMVAPSGKVVHTEVVGGNPLLAQSATDAVSKFVWEPRSAESRELIEINFRYGAD